MSNSSETWTIDALDETKEDIANIGYFIAETAGSEYYGERFIYTAETVLNSLKTWPLSHRKYSNEYDDNIRRIEIPGYKAAIIYKTYEDTLEAIAVMAFHTLQNPETYNKIISERVRIADKKMSR
ncbi:MAG: hypothetical protein LBQ41_01080 [Candidatus Ancillula sp.]|nr:hypothetical protein [Candidatus Ancillula sp.]